MLPHVLRRYLGALRRTPLHPQWLLAGAGPELVLLRELPPCRLLDIGCADRWVEHALAPGVQYLGLDYPPTGEALYHARPCVFADAARLPFASSSVDVVTLFEVVEHLRFPREALSEAGRVLRPGGCLLLTIPFLYPIHDAPHDYQRYTAHGLRRDLEACGFLVERLEPRLGSAETAGLLACLALGGMAIEALRRRSPAVVFVPAIAVAVPLLNIGAWLAGRFLPAWPAVTAGYFVRATKR
ncbi:class I SAM-dependent methyltransferase [Sinimarinibacterium thermocellulolyticum]|uniref:Class I SAM-dependent methyltransferase n=1 Tax=Sinimarinibacterium thermocellulolyticum TaxID=3170016 RepID=A0ABV2A938_9GAMM